MITRRRVIAFGVTGAAALACGGGLAWLTVGYVLPDGDVAIALSDKELCIVRAIVEALLPADGDLPAGLDIGVHQRVDEEVWSAPDSIRSDLSAALQLLEHLPPLLGFPGRLSSLPPQHRVACLERAMRSGPTPVVQAVVGLKQMCHLFYYAHESTWSALGYDGPWISEPRPPQSAVAYARLLAARRSG